MLPETQIYSGNNESEPAAAADKLAATARWAIKHARTSSILSAREDPQEFAATLAAWTDQLHPETDAERRLVRRIAATDFRLERIVLIEANLLDAEMDQREDKLDEDWTDIDNAGRMALCFRDANRDSNAFDLLRRYESIFDRSIARNVRLVLDLQNNRRERQQQQQTQTQQPQPEEAPTVQTPNLQIEATAAPTAAKTNPGRLSPGPVRVVENIVVT